MLQDCLSTKLINPITQKKNGLKFYYLRLTHTLTFSTFPPCSLGGGFRGGMVGLGTATNGSNHKIEPGRNYFSFIGCKK